MKKFSEIIGWGNNTYGQLGLSSQDSDHEPVPRIYTFQIEISAISCGSSHTLILSSTGYVYSFGSNESGQLGLGESVSGVKSIPSPSLIRSISKISKITSGAWHSMALSVSGELFTWGEGSTGCLGLGGFSSPCAPCKVLTPHHSACIQISAGLAHSAAILTDGVKASLFTCGEGRKGQLGTGRCCKEPSFVKVFENVLAVACGYEHTALITHSYRLWLTGSNENGQLGLGSSQFSSIFCKIESDDVIKVAASNLTACVSSSGKLLIAGGKYNGLQAVKCNLVVSDVAAGNNYCLAVDSNRGLSLWENGKLKGFKALVQKSIEKVAAGPDFFLAIGKSVDEDKRKKRLRNFSVTLDRPAATCRYTQREFFPKENSFKPFFENQIEVDEESFVGEFDVERGNFGRIDRNDGEKIELKRLVENLQREVERYKSELRSLKMGKEKEINEMKEDLERVSHDNLVLREENQELKEGFMENEKVRINFRNLTKENQELLHLNLKLESEYKALQGIKADALISLERFQQENDELRVRVSALVKANNDLTKEIQDDISSHIKQYKNKTIELLNNTSVSPHAESKFNRQNTPQKENIKTKLMALRNNRARIEESF